jgi:nucleoside-diphosphate-sugar epimerase
MGLLPEPHALRGCVVVVTGASGCLGRGVVRALSACGCDEVRAVDADPACLDLPALVATTTTTPPQRGGEATRVTARVCDVADAVAMKEVLAGADAVVHTASYGMSGPSMLNANEIHRVNIHGTRQLVDLAADVGARAFVYTSSYNVAFGGQTIVAGEEDACGYYPEDQHVDAYSRSKAIAERDVLSRADASNSDSGPRARLRRCALRPAAIFGPDETRHMPRIVGLVQRGLVRFAIGDPSTLVDWVYVDNLVSAHVLALANLLSDNPTAHLEAICISDDHPVNQFDFLAPLFCAVGGSPVTTHVPTRIVYAVAACLEFVYSVSWLGRVFDYVPLLTRSEVNKV